jgi:hypothetical protein
MPYESFFSSIVMRSSFVPRAGAGLALSGVEGTHPKLERVCVPSRGEVNDQELVVQGGRGAIARWPPIEPSKQEVCLLLLDRMSRKEQPRVPPQSPAVASG